MPIFTPYSGMNLYDSPEIIKENISKIIDKINSVKIKEIIEIYFKLFEITEVKFLHNEFYDRKGNKIKELGNNTKLNSKIVFINNYRNKRVILFNNAIGEEDNFMYCK